jgi:UDP-N-acetylglucosamine 2-epimerase (non-hydrolysing)
MKVHLVAAARPNFMKVAPLFHAARGADWLSLSLIHTGQHYDASMSDNFLRDLQLPAPDFHLNVGSGTHGYQTAHVMLAYEQLCLATRPDITVVVGDVNSTLACTLVAAKLGIPIAHLEAGLRSYDRTMPEEVNRVVTDSLSDLLWTPSHDAGLNLEREGIDPRRIEFVGNIMIDSLEFIRPQIEGDSSIKELSLERGGYALVTLHRPSNVDSPTVLSHILEALLKVSRQVPIVLPLHPRTRKVLREAKLLESLEGAKSIRVLEPLPYRSFVSLMMHAKAAVTDSGGVQEETSYFGVPCLTLRPNTERPITITHGTNCLTTIEQLEFDFSRVLASPPKRQEIPLWDGKTAGRVLNSLHSWGYLRGLL